jgi:hypothetical protein
MSARSLRLDLHRPPRHDISRDSAPSETRAARWGPDSGYVAEAFVLQIKMDAGTRKHLDLLLTG